MTASTERRLGLPSVAGYRLPQVEEFPPNRLDWEVIPDRAALLIHDLQDYFLRIFPSGVSPVPELIEHIRVLRDRCDALNIPVYYTAQPGNQDPGERGLQAHFWGSGMRNDLTDIRIVEALKPGDRNTVLTKWRYSAFQRSSFDRLLAEGGRDQLIVTGVYAHIGCLLTAADAFMRDIRPFFVGDAVADFSRERHDEALAYVARTCGKVLSTRQLMEAL